MNDRDRNQPSQSHEVRNNMLQSRSITEIFSFFEDLDVDPAKVDPRDIQFAYVAMFGPVWSNAEMEELRTSFLERVGEENARRLCKYLLHHRPVSHPGEGITDDELETLLSCLTTDVILLLHHHELDLKQAWSHHVSKSKRINPHRHVRARRVGALVDSGNSR